MCTGLSGFAESSAQVTGGETIRVATRIVIVFFIFSPLARIIAVPDRKRSRIMPVSQYRNAMYGTLFVLLCGSLAYADNEDAIATCARIAAVGDRILCLENALRQPSSEVGESHAEAAVLPASAKQTDESPNPETEAPESHMDEDVLPASATQSVTSPPPEAAVSSSAAAVTATAIVTDDAPVAAENYGLKEPQPPQEANTLQVIVTSVRKNLSNRFVFETEDDQVWLQTDQRTVRYEETPFKAEIRPASMGSFFLKPDSGGASIRVRREK